MNFDRSSYFGQGTRDRLSAYKRKFSFQTMEITEIDVLSAAVIDVNDGVSRRKLSRAEIRSHRFNDSRTIKLIVRRIFGNTVLAAFPFGSSSRFFRVEVTGKKTNVWDERAKRGFLLDLRLHRLEFTIGQMQLDEERRRMIHVRH